MYVYVTFMIVNNLYSNVEQDGTGLTTLNRTDVACFYIWSFLLNLFLSVLVVPLPSIHGMELGLLV